jgi:hypothetical protein
METLAYPAWTRQRLFTLEPERLWYEGRRFRREDLEEARLETPWGRLRPRFGQAGRPGGVQPPSSGVVGPRGKGKEEA